MLSKRVQPDRAHARARCLSAWGHRALRAALGQLAALGTRLWEGQGLVQGPPRPLGPLPAVPSGCPLPSGAEPGLPSNHSGPPQGQITGVIREQRLHRWVRDASPATPTGARQGQWGAQPRPQPQVQPLLMETLRPGDGGVVRSTPPALAPRAEATRGSVSLGSRPSPPALGRCTDTVTSPGWGLHRTSSGARDAVRPLEGLDGGWAGPGAASPWRPVAPVPTSSQGPAHRTSRDPSSWASKAACCPGSAPRVPSPPRSRGLQFLEVLLWIISERSWGDTRGMQHRWGH